MSDRLRLFLGLAAIVGLLVAATPQLVSADGGVIALEFQDVQMPAQKAILVFNEENGHEDLILSVALLGGSEAAWVVPVPSLPEVKAASPEWFEQLSELTAPKIETRTVRTGWPCGAEVCMCTSSVEVEAGVELISREQVGIYDVSILSADEPGMLLDWLNENGYAFPEEAGPLLESYVQEGGWYFVAARVLPGENATLDGDVQPLWFSFDAEQPVYPMRMTALMKGWVDVLIYVLADHRMETKGFYREFAGELVLHSRPEEADLLNLLTSRPYYVTKLRNSSLWASTLAEDLYLLRAANDEEFRRVIYRTTYEECRPAPAVPLATATAVALPGDQFRGGSGWLVLGVGLALLGLVAGLALIWQWSRRKPGAETDA